MSSNQEESLPLTDHNYQGSPSIKQKKKNFTENEKRIIRKVNAYFVKLLDENNIVDKKDGIYKQKTAGMMTREAIGLTKSTFYRIMHEFDDKNFVVKKDLNLHQNKQTEKSPEKSNDEGKKEQKSYFIFNMNEYVNGTKKIPAEGIPGVDLSNPKLLSKVMKTLRTPVEDDTKKIECTHEGCTKKFKDKISMRKHLYTHGPKVHTCNECNKSYYNLSQLKKHMSVHSGQKPFGCTFAGCNKRFTNNSTLKSHMRTHKGHIPFVCPFDGCSEKFARSNDLKLHILTHTNPHAIQSQQTNPSKESSSKQSSLRLPVTTIPINIQAANFITTSPNIIELALTENEDGTFQVTQVHK